MEEKSDASGLVVETYSSYAYAVEPRGFVLDNQPHVVQEIVRRWRTPGCIHFYVRDERDEFTELTYDEPREAWTAREFGKTCPRNI